MSMPALGLQKLADRNEIRSIIPSFGYAQLRGVTPQPYE
jgi:hypothetical protein